MKRCPACRRVYDRDARFCQIDGTILADFNSDPLIGQTIAKRYRLVRRLGHGPLGAVYLAAELATGRSVAVKILFSELQCDDDALKQCLWDARFATASRPSHIVRVYEVDRTDEGRVFIAMEYLEGEALSDLVSDNETVATVVAGTGEFSTPFATCELRAGTTSFGHRSKACTPPAATDVATVVGWSRPLLP